MATIKFTAALKRFFPNLTEIEVDGTTVAEALRATEAQYPGITEYLLDERGAVRQHMNIFVKGELIADRTTLQDKLGENDEVVIFQALSGG
ncbi:MAG: MoaD/ThiS family protein [Bacteroidota bacterium]